MELLDILNTRLNRIVCGFLTAVFTVMVVVVFAQVIFRYSLEQPLSWSEEVARYMFIWATFLGASVAFYENTHINVTYFTDHIPNVRARALVMILADLASMTFLGMYVYQGFIVSNRVFTLGQFSPSMEWLPIDLGRRRRQPGSRATGTAASRPLQQRRAARRIQRRDGSPMSLVLVADTNPSPGAAMDSPRLHLAKTYSFLWLPSHKGALVLCLQPQK